MVEEYKWKSYSEEMCVSDDVKEAFHRAFIMVCQRCVYAADQRNTIVKTDSMWSWSYVLMKDGLRLTGKCMVERWQRKWVVGKPNTVKM